MRRFKLLLCITAMAAIFAADVFAGDAPRDPIVSRQAMVRLQPGSSVLQFNQTHGSTLLDSIASRNIHLLRIPETAFDEDTWVTQVLSGNSPEIVWLEPNYEGQDGEGRTGSFYISQLGSNLFFEQYARDRLRLPSAHDISTGEGILVAVLDTGIDATHPALIHRIAPGGYNFIDNNTNTQDVADQEDNDNDGLTDESHGHGTFVAGLIHMVAPDAMLLPVKVLNSDGHGSGFHFAAGMFHAIDQGADVLNLSFGSTYDARAVEDALNEARTQGIAVVAAAGNRNIEDPEEHPATIEDLCIGIAATDDADSKSSFSNYHRKLALSAPGSGGIYSTIPTNSQGHQYAEWEGTSFSTALTAGAVAVVMSANPDWPTAARALATKQALQTSADPINHALYDDGYLGAGRLDVYGSLLHSPVVTNLVSIDITFGTHLTGSVADLVETDDDNDDAEIHLTARSAFGFLSSEPNVLELDCRFATTATSPNNASIRIRSRTNNPGGAARFRLRNTQTGSLDTIQTLNTSQTFVVQNVGVDNAGRYVDAATGEVEFRIRHIVIATFSLSGFISSFDELSMTLQ